MKKIKTQRNLFQEESIIPSRCSLISGICKTTLRKSVIIFCLNTIYTAPGMRIWTSLLSKFPMQTEGTSPFISARICSKEHSEQAANYSVVGNCILVNVQIYNKEKKISHFPLYASLHSKRYSFVLKSTITSLQICNKRESRRTENLHNCKFIGSAA